MTEIKKPWLTIGDLNEVLYVTEKQRGQARGRKKLYVNSFMKETRGINLGFVGGQFTWDNGQSGLALIRERLDKAVVDHQWMLLYPKAIIEKFATKNFDHCPIFLNNEGK